MIDLSEKLAWISKPIISFGDVSISTYNIIFAVIVLSALYWFTRMVRVIFEKIAAETDENNHHALYVIQRFVHYAIIVFGCIVALSVLGVDMSKLAMIATALSVGIGMGMQSIFNNFFSGFIILFERSLKVGDYIELEKDFGGVVIEIRVRSTLIRTIDNLDVVVPNSEFVTGRVTNWTHNDSTRRLRIPFGVAYGTDVSLVKRVVMEAAAGIPTTLEEPQTPMDVWLEKFGESSLDFILAVWVDPRRNTRPGALVANYLEAIEAVFRKHGIEIPFPQRDVYIRKNTLPDA